MKDLLQAFSFLTILPFGRGLPSGERELARSMAFFPVVGLAIGLLLAVGYDLFSYVLPRPLALWLMIGLLVFLTRGLHLDGLADTMDGLGSGGSRERVLDVMRDSRIGAFGVISLILLIGGRYFALHHLSSHSITYPLILMTVTGRNSMVLVCYRSPYARSENGLAKPFAENLHGREVFVSFILALGISLWAMGFKGILVFLGIVLFSLGYRSFFVKKLGGVTGDILGGANELSECLSLVLLVIFDVLRI